MIEEHLLGVKEVRYHGHELEEKARTLIYDAIASALGPPSSRYVKFVAVNLVRRCDRLLPNYWRTCGRRML